MPSPKALLLVYTEVGAHIEEPEYHDWYNNEHIPLRKNISDVFTGGISRLKSVDGSKPVYAATYDLESAAGLENPAYTNLAATRSARESNMFAKLGLIDIRVYDVYQGPSLPPSQSFDVTKGAPYSVLVEAELPAGAAEDDYNKWYDEEHIPLLSKIPGWLRSRRFVLASDRVLGTDTGAHKRTGRPAKYLAIHDWETSSSSGKTQTDEYKAAMGTEWMAKVEKTIVTKTKREFETLKTW